VRSTKLPFWFWLSIAVCLFANELAGVGARRMVALMSGVSEFARAVRIHNEACVPIWLCTSYTVVLGLCVAYLWPLARWFADHQHDDVVAPDALKRRAVSAPLVVAGAGYVGWLVGIPFFIGLTLYEFGTWSPELMSQHVITPILNGFLAAIVDYLLLDWIFRSYVVGRFFPEGGLADLGGTYTLGVRGRLLALVAAVGFVPLFTMLGLIQATAALREDGVSAEQLLSTLTSAGQEIFLIYLVLGATLTLLVARFLTGPLEAAADALRRVRSGDLEISTRAQSADEVGIVADGVAELATTLRDRERILTTFGRVVEPQVRDHLLSGRFGGAGEMRRASIMFVDLRNFTGISEGMPPAVVVEMLNEFFTVLTSWVRECGGFVDKFLGDALLVVFGLFDEGGNEAPDAGARAAVACALGIEARLEELNRLRSERGESPLSVSIGIHTGDVLAGTIGSADRHEYTIIGDAVNVAARLQELAKEDAHGLLISKQAYVPAVASGVVQAGLESFSVELRGRKERVDVFSVSPRTADD
jgi:adenylate cyclase